MGKHSNIIFCSEEGMIIDSIKHISSQVSSVREVLPGRTYFIPETQEKLNPLDYESRDFIAAISSKPMPLAKSIYSSMTGISPLIAEEICHRASLDSGRSANSFSETELIHLEHQFDLVVDTVKSGQLTPNIVYEEQVPVDFRQWCHLPSMADFREEKFEYGIW